LQPHRIRTFTFSPDPDFEAKLLDIVGLYLHPPEHALVLCVDEKSGIQALDRTQPGLPLRARRPRTWTNEYVRNGTQALLAALDVATGRVIGRGKGRRTSVNVLRFMDEVVAAFPQRDLHVVLDNLNIHKNPAARRWLKRHPRVHFHHTPTHASWVNLIEVFFSILGKQGLSHRVDLEGLTSRISPAVPRAVQPDESPVHDVDQRAREAPPHHRSHQGGAPQWSTPEATAETCASSSRE
jgi:transposase